MGAVRSDLSAVFAWVASHFSQLGRWAVSSWVVWVGWLLPLAAELTRQLLFQRGRAEREREQLGEGLLCAASARSVHQLPYVIKRVFVFWGMSMLCFFKCKIVHVYWGSFCFEVKGQKVPLLHCTALVMTLFLFWDKNWGLVRVFQNQIPLSLSFL